MIFRLHYSRFCYKDASGAPADNAGHGGHEKHERLFGHFEHGRAQEFFRNPEEPGRVIDRITSFFRGNGGPNEFFEQDRIFANVSERVRGVLGGLPNAADLVREQRDIRERGGHGSIWTRNVFDFFRRNPRGNPRMRSLDDQAEYDVNMPGYISSNRIDEYFLARGLSDVEKKRRTKILDRMKHAMGDTIVNKRMNHPVFLMAVRTLLQAPSANHEAILDGLFGKEQNLLPDVEQKSRALADVNSNYKTIEETMKEVEQNKGEGFLENLRKVKVEMEKAKTDFETARNNRPAGGSPAVAEAYRTQLAGLEKDYEKLEAKYKKLNEIYHKLQLAQETFYRRLGFLVPDANPVRSQLRHSERDHYDHLYRDFSFHPIQINPVTDTDPAIFALRPDVISFNKFFRDVTSEDFHIQFRGLKKHVEHEVRAAQKPKKPGEDGADPAHPDNADGAHVKMTENELMYKILYYRATKKVAVGGDIPDAADDLTATELERRKSETALDAFFLISEAKKIGMILDANKLRAERLAKLRQRPGFWRGLIDPSRNPMKDLPALKTLFTRMKFVRLEKLDETGAVVKDESGATTIENPFAHVKLKPGMNLADLRLEIADGRLQKQDIPRMIGYMEAMLAGQDRYQIRYDDITPLVDMITNLRLLKVFDEHGKFMKEVAENPDDLDTKLADLWKNDLKISEKVDDKARQQLLKIMRGDYKRPDSYKKQVENLMTEAKTKYKAGEFDFVQAKEFLKNHGVPVGILSGLGLVLSANTFNIAKWLAGKLPKTPKEEAGKIESAGLLRKTGYQLTRPFRWAGNNLIAKPTKFVGRNFIKKPAKFIGVTAPKALLINPAVKFSKWTYGGLASGGNWLKAVPGRVGRKFLSELKAVKNDFIRAAENFPTGSGGGGHGAAPAH